MNEQHCIDCGAIGDETDDCPLHHTIETRPDPDAIYEAELESRYRRNILQP